MSLLASQLDNIDLTSQDEDEVVITGFMDRYDVSYPEAKEIFDETKKFLELAVEVQDNEGINLFIDRPLFIIDEMWHTFILHTKQYIDFCFKNFSKFIHHRPTPKKEKDIVSLRFQENPSQVINETKEKLMLQYSFIYDKYGAETLMKWYEEWANKYTPEYLSRIKKAS